MYSIFSLLFVRLPKSDIYKARLGSAVLFFCLYDIMHFFNLHFKSFHVQRGNVCSTSLVLSDYVSVLLDVFFPLL